MKRYGIGCPLFILVVGVLAVASCGPRPPTPTPPLPIATPTPTPTSAQITLLTATVSPSVSPEPSETPTSTPCPPPEDWVPYVVEPGDNLYRLALPYGLTAEDLQEANCLSSADEIHAGQRIYIPWYITPTPTPCYPRGDWVPYTVQPGDNLYRIAVRYGLSVWDIQSGNCLESDLVWEGQILYVPYLIPTSVLPPSSPGEMAFYEPTPPPPEDTPTPIPASECSRPTWQEIETDAISAHRLDSGFQIDVAGSNTWAVAKAGCRFEDVTFHGRVQPITLSHNSAFGYVCRYQDDQNYYALLINASGEYNVAEVKNGTPSYLREWSSSGIDIQTGQTIELAIACAGNALRLAVDEVPLASATLEAPWPQGDIGVVVATFEGLEASVVFSGEQAEQIEP